MPNVWKHSSFAMVPDDTTLISSGTRTDKILNVDIGHTTNWLACNKLTINKDNVKQ